MAKKKKSALSGLSKKSVKAASKIEVRDGGQIPGGIQNGVAELKSCYFATHEDGQHKGKPFFRASGVVVEGDIPGSKRKVEGLTTSIFRPVYDTKTQGGKETSEAEHIAWIENEMKKLGADGAGEASDGDDLEAMAEALSEAQPHFSFTTTQSEPSKEWPNPRVWENWYGFVEDYEPGEEDDEVDEDDDEDEDEDEEEEDDVEEDDVEEDDVEEDDVEEDDVEEDDEEEDEFLPEKKDMYNYKPPKAKKAIEVEVTAVFKGKETCNLKSSDTGKAYKGVSWDKLEEPD